MCGFAIAATGIRGFTSYGPSPVVVGIAPNLMPRAEEQ